MCMHSIDHLSIRLKKKRKKQMASVSAKVDTKCWSGYKGVDVQTKTNVPV